jgi:DNA repair protein RadC
MLNKNTSSYSGHRKRLKDKHKISDLRNWLDYEVLEYALAYAIPRKDTKPLAKELISKFKSFAAVLDAEIKDLMEVKGISEHTALFIKLLKDSSYFYIKNTVSDKNLLNSPELVVSFLKNILKGSFDEEFYSIYLNKNNQLISAEMLQKGTVDKSVVYPRKIVERSIYNHAVSVIIAHNHPGGTLNPSKNDIEVTKAVKNALDTVDILLLDHIIITGNGYFSFKEQNLI